MSSRVDKRALNQLRPFSVRFGLIKTADGSAEVSVGGTSVVASVHGPVGTKGRLEQIDRTTIKVAVESFSSAPSLKDTALAEKIESILHHVVFEMLHPRTLVAITIQPTSIDGSFVAVAVNAAICALLDAAVPMKRVAFAALCVKNEAGQLVLDPTEREENENQFLVVFDPTMPETSLYLNHSGGFELKELPEITKFLYENGVCPVHQAVTAALRQIFE